LVTLAPVDELIIDIGKTPLLLFLPRMAGFSVDLYMQVQTANIFLASLSQTSTVSGVYFRAGGRIIVSPISATVFEYFAIRPTRPCPIFQLTTYPSDFFTAHVSDKKSNLTIKNNQKYCLFHVTDSSELTSVAVNYSTEDSYDILYFTDGETERPLTGHGSYHNGSSIFSLFTWISDATTLSKSFSLRVSSPRSHLPPIRLNYTAQSWPDTGTDPVVLQGASVGAAAPRPTSIPYANADVEVFEKPTDHKAANRAIIGAVVGITAFVIGAVVVWRWRQGEDMDAAMLVPGSVGLVGLDPTEASDGDRLQITSAAG
jgi:hypothetical protein